MYCTRRPYFSSLTRPQDWIKYFPYILELMDNGNIKPFRIICRQVDILFFRSDILAIIPYGKTLRGLCKGGGVQRHSHRIMENFSSLCQDTLLSRLYKIYFPHFSFVHSTVGDTAELLSAGITRLL